jgi:hypothetical protein
MSSDKYAKRKIVKCHPVNKLMTILIVDMSKLLTRKAPYAIVEAPVVGTTLVRSKGQHKRMQTLKRLRRQLGLSDDDDAGLTREQQVEKLVSYRQQLGLPEDGSEDGSDDGSDDGSADGSADDGSEEELDTSLKRRRFQPRDISANDAGSQQIMTAAVPHYGFAPGRKGPTYGH